MPWVPWSKGKSTTHRSPDAAWEYVPDTMRPVRRCATIPGTVRALHIHCAERLVSFQGTVPPAPVLPLMPNPSKGHGDTLEERTTADPAHDQGGAMTQGERDASPLSPPALCGHPGPMLPYLVLWSHSRCCGALFRRDITTSASVQSKFSHQQDPCTGLWTTTRHTHRQDHPQNHLQVQESPRRPRDLGFARTTITPRALYAIVTTPPEIIPYYRLNHSIWSLSDNKETSR
jgi:hypothetical protein